MKRKRTIVPAAWCAVGVVAGACMMHLLRPPRPRPERVVVMTPPRVLRPPASERIPIIGAPPVPLRRPVGEFRSDGERLDEVIDRLRSSSKANIFVNWKALQAAGVMRDLPVTFRTPGPTLADALDQLLTELSGTGGPRLGYEMEDEDSGDQGVVTISTGDDLLKQVVTRVYDIRHLIRGADSRREAVAAVIRTVEGVDPLSWRNQGGSVGMPQELSGRLVVTHTVTVPRRIGSLLADDLSTGQARPRPTAPSGRAAANLPTTGPAFLPLWTDAEPPPTIRDVTRTH